MNTPPMFEGFWYAASEISSYLYTLDTFIISLKSGAIVRFVYPEREAFQNWLDAHQIPHIHNRVQRLTQNYYSKSDRKK